MAASPDSGRDERCERARRINDWGSERRERNGSPAPGVVVGSLWQLSTRAAGDRRGASAILRFHPVIGIPRTCWPYPWGILLVERDGRISDAILLLQGGATR